MTDRELLEAAARAAGNGVRWYAGIGMGIDTGAGIPLLWNPLTDDGDALRLAVNLGMELDFEHDPICAGLGDIGVREPWGEDKAAATRRAIVRAAAAQCDLS